MKLSCICVGESPLFFYFRMVISALGVKTREGSRVRRRVRKIIQQRAKG